MEEEAKWETFSSSQDGAITRKVFVTERKQSVVRGRSQPISFSTNRAACLRMRSVAHISHSNRCGLDFLPPKSRCSSSSLSGPPSRDTSCPTRLGWRHRNPLTPSILLPNMLLIFLARLILEARRADGRRATTKSGRLVRLTRSWMETGRSI